MRWQRTARVGVAIVGLSCAGALVIYLRHQPAKAVPSAAAPLQDPTATAQRKGMKGMTFKSSSGEGAVTEIAAEFETTYADGRSKWSQVQMTTKRSNGTFHMWADSAETKGKAVNGDDPGEILLHGHIKVTTDDGLEVHTEEATYDNVQGLATMPGKVTFTKGQMSGEGVGATYDRERNVLWLQDQAHVTQKPDEKGAGAFELSAKAIGVARNEHYINLAEHARIVREGQTLSGDNSIVHFTEDEKGLQQIELHGNASVVPGRGAKNNTEMSASDIVMDFQPDGQNLKHAALAQNARLVQPGDGGKQVITATAIDMVTAPDGKTLVNLDAKENVVVTLPVTPTAPGRVITALSLVASGDEKVGLKAAMFEGGVQFTESQPAARGRGAAPGSTRKGTSSRLVLDLGGQLSAITNAEFRDKVVFTDQQMKGTADIANYDETQGIMVLTPAKGSTAPATVDDGSIYVDAMELIRIDMNTHDLRARDRVRSRMTQAKGATDTHTPALFDASQPVLGSAAEMAYVSKTKSARFVGSATTQANVYQDPDNSIRGDRIEVEQDTGNLTATGNVKSWFILDSTDDKPAAPKPVAGRAVPAPAAGRSSAAPAAKKPAPSIGNADRLEYRDADRKATYVGTAEKPASLKSTTSIDAEQIVLTLAAESRTLDKLEATKSVYVAFDDGKESVAAKLVYDAKPDKYTLSGSPMFFKNVETTDGQRKCSYETSTELDYDLKTQTWKIPQGRSLKPTTTITCDVKLKAISQAAK